MKKVILTLTFACMAIIAFAQNIDKGTDKKGNLCLKKGDKIVVKATFEKVGQYDNEAGMIPAKLNGKWGFYDNDGKLVIPHQYELMTFENVSSLYGWYLKGQDRIEVSMGGRKFFIDKTGKESSPPEYQLIVETPYTGEGAGMGAGYFFKKNGKWALADKNKKVLTEFKYDVIRGPIGVNPFVYKGTRDGQDFRLSAEGVEEAGIAPDVIIRNDKSYKIQIYTGVVGRDGNTHSSIETIAPGSTLKLSCAPGREIAQYNDGKKGKLLFTVTSELCGKTINLSAYY